MLWEFIKWSPDGKSFDLQTNSLNQFFREMYGDQSGELVFEYWGLKSLTVITALSIIQGHEVKWSAVSRPWNRLPELFPSLLQWQKHLHHGHQKEQIFLLFHKLMVRSFTSLSKMESSRMGYSTIILLKSLNRAQILHTVARPWPLKQRAYRLPYIKASYQRTCLWPRNT